MMMGLQLMVLSRQMCLLDLNCCHSTLQWMQLSLLLFGLQREDFAFLEEADDCHPGLQAGMFGCGRQRLCVCMCVCVCVCVRASVHVFPGCNLVKSSCNLQGMVIRSTHLHQRSKYGLSLLYQLYDTCIKTSAYGCNEMN